MATPCNARPGMLLDPGAPINKGLVGWWPMWEGSGGKTLDISGKNNHGTLTNGPLWAGGGLKFDGTDDYVDAGNNSNLRITGTNISVFGWVRPESQSTYRGIIAKYGAAGQRSYLLYMSNVNKPSFLISTGGTLYYTDRAGNADTVPDNVWSFLVGTFDGRYVKIYRNGDLKYTDDIGTSGNAIDDSTTQPVEMGRYTGANFFKGSLSGGRICSRTLNASEVQQLYVKPNIGLWVPDITRYYIPAAGGADVRRKIIPAYMRFAA